uniref:Lamin-B receptor of TUDOR domain-containing protein n=1 Tax=Ciona savignyi TaxID=51511 RepID=H2ZJL1_CIOSA
TMKWSLGDNVMAKWPGSALYFPAVVQKIDEKDGYAEVLFSDGTTMDVDLKFLKAEATFKRRTRSKSPARSRRRSRSPSRKQTRSTTRESLDRKSRRINTSSSSSDEKKFVATVNLEPKKANEEIKVKTTKTKVCHLLLKLQNLSKVEITKTIIPDSRYMVTRKQVKEMYMSKAANVETKLKEEESPSAPVVNETNEFEYGGVLGVFFMYLTLPLLPLTFLAFCNQNGCSITQANYYDPMSTLIVLQFLLFHALIYALPFGYVIKGPATPNGKKLDYRISAMYSLVFTFAAYGALYYYKFPITSIKLLPLATAATLASYIGVILVHLKSRNTPNDELNPHGNSGSVIYDSFLGRELHPRIGSLFDLKLYLYRPGMAAWLVLVMIEMQKQYEADDKFSPQILLLGVSQILYIILEFFWDEEQCPFMFDIKNEGLGFVQFFGELVIVPFIYSLPVRYAVEHPTALQTTQIAGLCLLLVVGFGLIVLSGRQKSMFRKNPFDPKLSYLESLPPSRPGGDRLLVSGFWGMVRHPNYLGEIVVGFAWSAACGVTHLLPWFYPIFVVGLLCHRALRDDVRCRQKHGLAWKIYCQRVKY